MTKLICIASCGRSGTKWFLRSLGRAPEISTSGEVKPLFHWILAYLHGMRHAWRNVRDGCDELAASSPTPLHVTKCSPILWMAERLLHALPEIRFVGLLRDPYSVVASSMLHDGIRARLQNAPGDGWPNQAIGVRHAADLEAVSRLTVTGRAAWKWCKVAGEIRRLAEKYPKRFRAVSYEDAILAPDTTAAGLSDWLGAAVPPFEGDRSKIDKWRRTLRDPDAVTAVLASHGFSWLTPAPCPLTPVP